MSGRLHGTLEPAQHPTPSQSPQPSTEKGHPMFPEYRDLITRLKHKDHHFTRLFDKHNELDQKIWNMEEGTEVATQLEIEALKREKLQLKDELYAVLKKANGD
jgi:uncharacterized protein YdcH (DUF465 family)